ncbi:MAG TPA: hypothetical protein VFZ79_13425, partial [Acidimicrobiales bacterium]
MSAGADGPRLIGLQPSYSRQQRRNTMRLRRLMAVPAVAVLLIAAACGDDDDGDDGAADGGGGEDTGSVNVLNAMEPEEADIVQGVVDETMGDVDYSVEIEASADFEEQYQIRSEGGTLDVALLPQPGQVADSVEQGAISL